MYLATTIELERVVGRWEEEGKESSSGPNPERRLNTFSSLWKGEVDPVCQTMQRFRVQSLERVYDRITAKHRYGELDTPVTAWELCQLTLGNTSSDPGTMFDPRRIVAFMDHWHPRIEGWIRSTKIFIRDCSGASNFSFGELESIWN